MMALHEANARVTSLRMLLERVVCVVIVVRCASYTEHVPLWNGRMIEECVIWNSETLFDIWNDKSSP
jgi:hypothetical protein